MNAVKGASNFGGVFFALNGAINEKKFLRSAFSRMFWVKIKKYEKILKNFEKKEDFKKFCRIYKVNRRKAFIF